MGMARCTGDSIRPTVCRMLVGLLVCEMSWLLLDRVVAAVDGGVVYRDSSQPIEDRVTDLLSRMTVQEKIGQMTQIERAVADPSVISQYFIGSVLSGGGSVPAPKASPSVWADMIDNLQHAATSTRLGIPMIYGINAVHGNNNIYGATIFPHNIGLGATRDPLLAKRIGAATALEARGTGIPYVFAPCIAVCRDPRWGRCYESYSEDTQLVRSMTEIITGLQGQAPTANTPFVESGSRVAACAKHFVGDGGTIGGVDESNTVINYEKLDEIHMVPYVEAIAKGGFTISDWEGIDRITCPWHSNYTYSVLSSVNAGIDMVMVPFQYASFITTLTALVTDGSISMERVDDAVRRILRVKFTLGLFEQPFSNRSLTSAVGQSDNRELAREAVRKSLVLLKNGQTGHAELLPLSKNVPSILVAGSHANDIGNQCGGWTISWQGAAGNTTPGTTILQAISNTVATTTQVDFQEAPDANYAKGKNFSYAIVVVGETPYAEYEGDSTTLTIPSEGIQTIQNVCSSVQCLVILISGRPLIIEPYLPFMDALVAAWLPGTEGQGIADVIFGDQDFVGKLPRTWMRTVAQLPLNVGDLAYDPLFPYGFGLSMNISTTTLKNYVDKKQKVVAFER